MRHNPRAAPAPAKQDGSYDATIMVTPDMVAQLQARQARYNVSWVEEDMDASWLAPSRLLLYIYVARPTPALHTPVVLIDGTAASVTGQYNSRGLREERGSQADRLTDPG